MDKIRSMQLLGVAEFPLRDNPAVSHISVHLISGGCDHASSHTKFSRHLYSEHPCNIETVVPCRDMEGMFAVQSCKENLSLLRKGGNAESILSLTQDPQTQGFFPVTQLTEYSGNTWGFHFNFRNGNPKNQHNTPFCGEHFHNIFCT